MYAGSSVGSSESARISRNAAAPSCCSGTRTAGSSRPRSRMTSGRPARRKRESVSGETSPARRMIPSQPFSRSAAISRSPVSAFFREETRNPYPFFLACRSIPSTSSRKRGPSTSSPSLLQRTSRMLRGGARRSASAYPVSSSAARILSRVRGLTPGRSCSTSETVAGETPSRSARSLSFGLMRPPPLNILFFL